MNVLEFLRQFRIFEYAIFDLAVTFFGVYLLSSSLSKIFRRIGIDIPDKSWLALTLPIGIAIHLLLGTFTPMTTNFIDMRGHYILKLIILGSLIIGLKEIKLLKK